jgi:hypothetical protein
MYLSNKGESSPDNGGGSPSSFVLGRIFMINLVNIKINIFY